MKRTGGCLWFPSCEGEGLRSWVFHEKDRYGSVSPESHWEGPVQLYGSWVSLSRCGWVLPGSPYEGLVWVSCSGFFLRRTGAGQWFWILIEKDHCGSVNFRI